MPGLNQFFNKGHLAEREYPWIGMRYGVTVIIAGRTIKCESRFCFLISYRNIVFPIPGGVIVPDEIAGQPMLIVKFVKFQNFLYP
jgi:hypothetical protein